MQFREDAVEVTIMEMNMSQFQRIFEEQMKEVTMRACGKEEPPMRKLARIFQHSLVLEGIRQMGI